MVGVDSAGLAAQTRIYWWSNGCWVRALQCPREYSSRLLTFEKMLWVRFPLAPLLDNRRNLLTSKIGTLFQKTVETKQLRLLGAVTETQGPLEGDVTASPDKLTGKSWDWPENLQSLSAVGREQGSDDLRGVPGAQIRSQILKRIRGNQSAVGEPVEKTIDWPNPLHDRVHR